MRWFKHMTASSQDDKLIQLKDEFGMEGYGVYWAIIEMIATQINQQNQQTFVEFSVKSWRKITEFSPKKLENFAVFSNKIDLFNVTFNGNKIRFCAPNILKYKDEYSRKSGQTPDIKPLKVRTKSGATPEEEIKKDKEPKKETDRKTIIPKDFTLSEDLIEYAKSKNITDIKYLEDYTEGFILQCQAKKYKYVDFNATWKNWFRKHIQENPPPADVNRIPKDVYC